MFSMIITIIYANRRSILIWKASVKQRGKFAIRLMARWQSNNRNHDVPMMPPHSHVGNPWQLKLENAIQFIQNGEEKTEKRRRTNCKRNLDFRFFSSANFLDEGRTWLLPGAIKTSARLCLTFGYLKRTIISRRLSALFSVRKDRSPPVAGYLFV
ncbi:hypothetical protein KFK09_016761 [Dendrobium nobile]|uniref:Uncharacterized protein n=1 Tax=Dendrobium nobile TaxID=94219 RepID=A0A8T3AZ22_DENNO|nr:hypothetical protein KFK09_016761 [Dendrobium nobile]